MARSIRLGKRFLGARIRYRRLSSSYWYRPLILVAVGLIGARLVLFIDAEIHARGFHSEDWWWVFTSDPLSNARSGLTTQATALLGMFGVLLSLALIPLTIATAQYSNVVLRNFLSDKGTQNVIGYFAFVIFFDLAAVVTMPKVIDENNYPAVTSTFSIILLLGALIAVIYFFNHIANLLQATVITKSVTDELMDEIESSAESAPADHDEKTLEGFRKQRDDILESGTMVRATRSGYVTGLDYQYLFAKASWADAVILVLKVPGDYVSQNEPLVKYVAKKKISPRRFARIVNSSYSLGVTRTVIQDIDYGVTLLTIIACKALSPAINDPITGEICIDKIGQVLSKVVARPTRSPYVAGKRGNLRLIAEPDNFESLMATGFNQIRQYGCHQFEIMVRQLGAIETIAYETSRKVDRKVIKDHADLILEDALRSLESEWSKEQVRKAYASAVKVIGLKAEAQVKPIASPVSP